MGKYICILILTFLAHLPKLLQPVLDEAEGHTVNQYLTPRPSVRNNYNSSKTAAAAAGKRHVQLQASG